MEHEFSLGDTAILIISADGKFVSVYFYERDPGTWDRLGKGFKMILPQYKMLIQNALLIQTTMFNGGKCGVNLGYKMVVEAGNEAIELKNAFTGQKFILSKENFSILFDKIMEIEKAIDSENMQLDNKTSSFKRKVPRTSTPLLFPSDEESPFTKISKKKLEGLRLTPWFADFRVLDAEEVFLLVAAEYAFQQIFKGKDVGCHCESGYENQEHPCPGRQSIHNELLSPTVNSLCYHTNIINACFDHILERKMPQIYKHVDHLIEVFQSIFYNSFGRRAIKGTVARFIDCGYQSKAEEEMIDMIRVFYEKNSGNDFRF